MSQKQPFIIAEVANAHQGDVEQLKNLVRMASECNADSIKFQWFKYDVFATHDYEWYDDYVKLFISEDDWLDVLNLSSELRLNTWIDICDKWGVRLAKKYMNKIYGFKLPSTVMQNQQILNFMIESGKPMIIGIGGWYDHEIEKFLSLIPSKKKKNVVLMHGFQGYPTQPEDVTLERIQHLKRMFGLKVGFADHEDGSSSFAVDLPAYSFFAGADIIEKHITFNRDEKGYDYYSSLEKNEFSEMVKKLQFAKIIKGNLSITENQRDYLKATIKSVAASDLLTGAFINDSLIEYKRCQDKDALSPNELKDTFPALVISDIKKDESITLKNVKKLKIVVAVICRLKSTRLHKKALCKINGVTSIERCLLNCLEINNVDEVYLATSDLESDSELGLININGRVKFVAGDPENVLERILKVADESEADIILRITGDCPVVSPEIINYLIRSHIDEQADFSTQTANHAVGTGGDVYNVNALKRLRQIVKKPKYTEYLSCYFINNPELFKINLVELPNEWQYSKWRLTLDEEKDLMMFEELYKGMNIDFEPVCFSQVIDFLNKNHQISLINQSVSLKWRDDKKFVDQLNKETKINLI